MVSVATRDATLPPLPADASNFSADEIDDGRPPVGVARGRDRPARLVEEDVPERLLADGDERPRQRVAQQLGAARSGDGEVEVSFAVVIETTDREQIAPFLGQQIENNGTIIFPLGLAGGEKAAGFVKDDVMFPLGFDRFSIHLDAVMHRIHSTP